MDGVVLLLCWYAFSRHDTMSWRTSFVRIHVIMEYKYYHSLHASGYVWCRGIDHLLATEWFCQISHAATARKFNRFFLHQYKKGDMVAYERSVLGHISKFYQKNPSDVCTLRTYAISENMNQKHAENFTTIKLMNVLYISFLFTIKPVQY